MRINNERDRERRDYGHEHGIALHEYMHEGMALPYLTSHRIASHTVTLPSRMCLRPAPLDATTVAWKFASLEYTNAQYTHEDADVTDEEGFTLAYQQKDELYQHYNNLFSCGRPVAVQHGVEEDLTVSLRTYIYIYIERERDICIYIYIYICTCICIYIYIMYM